MRIAPGGCRVFSVHLLVLAAVSGALGCWPAALGAQRAPVATGAARVRPAFRADAILDRDVGAQVAAGLVVAAAYNVRLALDAGIGAVQRPVATRTAGRVDLLARWLSDPFREAKWGLNAGGGVGLHLEQARAPRPVAIVTLGVEGPSDGVWVPGVEVGLGGGVRAGFTLRRAPLRRR